MKTPWKAGALVSVQLTDGPPREMRIATVRRTGPGTADVTLEAVSGPDELVCTCPLLACGRKMYPDAALLRCPGCGRPTATMGPCSMTSKPEGREVEAREGGTLQVDAGDRVTVDTETEAQVDLLVAFVATLPTGERVSLPAGTVLREGTLPPEPEDDRPTLGEQIHDEHDRKTHADGSCCVCDPAPTVLADLTERVGLPREMAPRCTGKRPANAGTTGIECDDYACNVHGRGAIRRLHEMAPSVEPAREAPPLPGPTPLDEAFRLGIHIGLKPLHEPERKPRT